MKTYRVGQGWFRVAAQIDKADVPLLVQSQHDRSPEYPHWAHGEGGYAPTCSCCWLHIPHSQEAHLSRVAKSRKDL